MTAQVLLQPPNRDVSTRSRGMRRGVWIRFVEQRRGMLAAFYLVGLALIAILASVIAPFDPTHIDPLNLLADPFSSKHLLGTDELGRDVLSRLLFAAQISVVAPLQVIIISLVLGVIPGLVAGYFSGTPETIIMRTVDSLQSIPPLLLAMALVAVFGTGLFNAMIAVGIVFTPSIVRVVRASVLTVRRDQYIEAAVTIGTPVSTILKRHVMPNIIGPLLVQSSLMIAFALLAEATLSFIGLGAQPPSASWGSMLSTGFRMLSRQPWLWFWPALMLSLTVLAWNVVGDTLRNSVGREERKG